MASFRRRRRPEFAARYTTGRRSSRAISVAALNTASSRGLKAPLWKVMSFAIATTCLPCTHTVNMGLDECDRGEVRSS